MNKRNGLLLAAAGIFGAVAVGFFTLRTKPATISKEAKAPVVANPAASKKKAVKSESDKTRRGSVTGRGTRVMIATNLAAGPEQQAVERTEDARKASEMRDLLDNGNEREALAMARSLMSSSEPEVRSQVVTVLGWIGMKALPELTEMLSDLDESVASDALNQWRMAYDELEDETAKAELLVAALGALRKTEDMEALVLSFSQLPEGLAIRSLNQIIQSGNEAAADVARGHYEFMVGEAYTTPEAALAVAGQRDLENSVPQ